jgi:hypothetical protein
VVAGNRTRLPLEVTLHMPTDDVARLTCVREVDRVDLGIRGARAAVPRAVQLDLAITLRREST